MFTRVLGGEKVSLHFLKNMAASLIPMTRRVNVMKGGGLRNQHSHSVFRGRGLGGAFWHQILQNSFSGVSGRPWDPQAGGWAGAATPNQKTAGCPCSVVARPAAGCVSRAVQNAWHLQGITSPQQPGHWSGGDGQETGHQLAEGAYPGCLPNSGQPTCSIPLGGIRRDFSVTRGGDLSKAAQCCCSRGGTQKGCTPPVLKVAVSSAIH